MQSVEWRCWGDEAFEESRARAKPVLLSISAVWCHWCHVMDRNSYADARVIEIIGQRFIPVRADNDRNPDINLRYNAGGWPSTVFLTCNRDIITAATYVPPIAFRKLLIEVSEAYSDAGDSLIARAAEVNRERESRLAITLPGVARAADVNTVLDAVRAAYDPVHGGFGSGQKFPHIPAIELLLAEYEKTGAEIDIEIAMRTLDAMMGGEVFDSVEGGMFRYATRPDWTEPHYEKMLADNAGILRVLIAAHRITRRAEFRGAAEGVLGYLRSCLRDPVTGAFFGSQDADEDYYRADATTRAAKKRPYVDTALYADTNAMVASALVDAWKVLKDEDALDEARRALGFFYALGRDADLTVPHYFEDGVAHASGYLADQAQLILANLACADALKSDELVAQAGEIADAMITGLASPSGALYDITDRRATERGLTRFISPFDTNSTAALALVRLARATGDASYRIRATSILNALSSQFRDYGVMAADYALAVMELDSSDS